MKPLDLDLSVRENPPLLSARERTLLVVLALVASAALRLWNLSIDLGPARYFDERYSFANVRSARNRGALQPSNAYYLGAGWIPVALTLRAAEVALAPFDKDSWVRYDRGRRRYPPLAYLIARLYSATCGILAIAGVAWLARRLFGDVEAVLAAFFIAGSWAALSYSSQFKPDSILFCGAVATFLALEATLRRPSLPRWGLVGLILGFSLGLKFNAAPLALPVGLAIVASGEFAPSSRRSAWKALAVTAATALTTFLVLNPHLSILWRDYNALKVQYRGRGYDPPLRALEEGLAFFLDPTMLGWLIGGLALVGLVVLGRWVLRHADVAVSRRITLGALVSFFPIYLVVYAFAAGHAKKNNFLLVLVPTAIAAAWLTARIVEHLPQRARRPLFLAIVLAAFCGRVLPLALDVREARGAQAEREPTRALDPGDASAELP